MMTGFDRRAFLTMSAAAALVPCRSLAQEGTTVRPEDFGARGDGRTNDTAAFAAMSAHVNRMGGGTILLGAGRTYLVGRQERRPPFTFSPDPIIELRELALPLRILGNGARLVAEAGLRFGTFDPLTGNAVERPMPNLNPEGLASPYIAMVAVHRARAPVEIRDLELDGSLPRLAIGGQYGDIGWQLPATGLYLVDNQASETVVNVFTHHHAQDGVMIDGDDRRRARSGFQRLVARHNGRQGVSIVGGRGYDFADCEFSFSGRSAILSPPGAGVDIEAEGEKTNRDLTFTRCKFIDNAGVGMVADSGDSEGAVFADCLFVGTSTWSAWPKKPRFRFTGCTFAGAMVHAFPDKDPDRAAQFRDCRFIDDPALSPDGRLYFGGAASGPVVNLAESDNVLFARCSFDLRHGGVLPWSWRATYSDCRMTQASSETAMTKGKYIGHNVVDGPVDIYGSMILGTLILNGQLIPQGPVEVEPW